MEHQRRVDDTVSMYSPLAVLFDGVRCDESMLCTNE